MTLRGEYESSVLPSVLEQVARYEATDGREGNTLEGRPVIILTHRGAKTGKLRKTPVMRIVHGDGYLVVASYGGAPINPAWHANLLAHPLVDIRDGATVRTMVAALVDAEQKPALWPVCDAAWPHFPEYRRSTDRDIPIFLLRPGDGGVGSLGR